MQNKENQEFNSLLSVLNNLAKGQKVMVELVGKLTNKEGSTEIQMGEQHKKDPINGEGSNSGEASCACTIVQSHPHIYSRASRPTMPQFLNETTIGHQEQDDQDIPFG